MDARGPLISASSSVTRLKKPGDTVSRAASAGLDKTSALLTGEATGFSFSRVAEAVLIAVTGACSFFNSWLGTTATTSCASTALKASACLNQEDITFIP